jgi:hypothetical protein
MLLQNLIMHVPVLLHDLLDEMGRSSQKYIFLQKNLPHIEVHAILSIHTLTYRLIEFLLFFKKFHSIQSQNRQQSLPSATPTNHC